MFTLFRTSRVLAPLRLPTVSGLVRFFGLARATRRQRRALLRLDDALLRDIGLDREAARAEASRPAWDVPRHWRV